MVLISDKAIQQVINNNNDYKAKLYKNNFHIITAFVKMQNEQIWHNVKQKAKN